MLRVVEAVASWRSDLAAEVRRAELADTTAAAATAAADEAAQELKAAVAAKARAELEAEATAQKLSKLRQQAPPQQPAWDADAEHRIYMEQVIT